MRVFEDIELQWNGSPYKIPADRVLGAIARIEEIVTLGELSSMFTNTKSLRIATLARAYGTLLRYAGASVSDEEVYGGMFQDSEGKTRTAVSAIESLLSMMIPPSAREESEKNLKRQADQEAAVSLSKNTTKRPSALAS